MKPKLTFPFFNEFLSRNRLRDLPPNCCVKRFFLLQKSNEESTDLSSQDKNHSTGEKRNSEAVTEEVEPAAKKLKTCEDQAPSEESSESPVPPKAEDTNSTTQSATPAANPAPQVAVWICFAQVAKIERKMTFTSSTFSRKTHEKKGSSEST